MIELKSGTRIWIAAGFTDLRRGFQGLSSIVETVLEQAPFSGHVFVFRGKRGDYFKAIYWDGSGLWLLAKRLEKGRFVWPPIVDGAMTLTPAQLAVLIEAAPTQTRPWTSVPSIVKKRLLGFSIGLEYTPSGETSP